MPKLYVIGCKICFHRTHMDPSGTFIQYDAKAIGSGSEGAQQSLQDVYHKVIRASTVIRFGP